MNFHPPDTTAPGLNPAAQLPPRVPDHELLRPIGRGAYGEVWLARSVLGAYRAVKIVRRASFDSDRPFEREFDGIRRFEPVSRQHDSQVDILHVGRGPGYFYYVMELADDQLTGGQIDPDHYAPRTLKSELLFHGRLPFEECVRIGIALATALEHLHANGLVHRDVKPSNIIFVNGIPKLADIGLVTGVDTTRSHVGTEGFAAPEGPGAPQADVYSLGKVLYEMATGKDRQEFPDLPTQLREWPDREGMVELNAVIAQSCRHDPKDRYRSAAAMRADLELLQGGKSLARLHRIEARLRLVQRIGVTITVLAAVIAAGWLWQARQTRVVRQLALEKTQLAEENRERIVRLDVANGVRLMDEDDLSGSLLWLADALPQVTNSPAEEEIHRIRIQQVLQKTPRLLVAVGYSNAVTSGAWSPDGRRFAITTTELRERKLWGQVHLHDAVDGRQIWVRELASPGRLGALRFSRDGSRIFICSPQIGRYSSAAIAFALDAVTGRPAYPSLHNDLAWSAYSPDDRWLALAHTNHVIQVLRAGDGTSVTELVGHTDTIRTLSFATDGTLLASASQDGTARLRRLPSGEPVGSPLVHDQPLRRAVLSGDGQRLATVTASNEDEAVMSFHLWDTMTGKRLGDVITDIPRNHAVLFSPGSGERLVLAGRNDQRGVIRILDTRAKPGAVIAELERQKNDRYWTFSPDGTLLAVGNDGGWLTLFQTATGEDLGFRLPHGGYLECAQFSPDGSRLLTTSDDGSAKVWGLSQQEDSAKLTLSTNLMRWEPEKTQIKGRISGPISLWLQDGALHFIDPKRLQEEFVTKPQQPDSYVAWADGSSGRFWAVTEAESGKHFNTPCNLVLWHKQGDAFHRKILPHPKFIPFCSFNTDDTKLISFCRDWAVRIWRTSDGQLERVINIPKSLGYVPFDFGPNWFSPDGQSLLVVHGKGRYLQLYDLNAERLIGQPFSRETWGLATMLSFAPDGHRLAKVGYDQLGAIADLRTGISAVPPFRHTGDLLYLEWSPDGKRLLTAGKSSRVRIWNTATGEQLLAPLLSGADEARAAQWSADGRFIVTRNNDLTARVWDATTAEPVTPPLSHSGYIRSALLTPGHRLITASDPNLLRAWDLQPTSLPAGVIADYAKLLSSRRLNASGTLLPLRSAELAALFQSLRARHPELFSSQ